MFSLCLEVGVEFCFELTSGINRHVFLPFVQTIRDNCVVWDMDSKTDFRAEEGEWQRRQVGLYIRPDEFDSVFKRMFGDGVTTRETIPLSFARQLDAEVKTTTDGKRIAIFKFNEVLMIIDKML